MIAILTTQAGAVTLRPPAPFLPLSARPVGVWKPAPATEPGSLRFRAGKNGEMKLYGVADVKPEDTLKLTPPYQIVKANGLVWKLNVDANRISTTVAGYAVSGRRVYYVYGSMTGGAKGRPAGDAIATLKTLKPL